VVDELRRRGCILSQWRKIAKHYSSAEITKSVAEKLPAPDLRAA